jgi:hypothetical protein
MTVGALTAAVITTVITATLLTRLLSSGLALLRCCAICHLRLSLT